MRLAAPIARETGCRWRKPKPIWVRRSVVSCFRETESSNLNRLVLIPFCLARAARAGAFARAAPATRLAGRAASATPGGACPISPPGGSARRPCRTSSTASPICCARSQGNYCRRRLPPATRRSVSGSTFRRRAQSRISGWCWAPLWRPRPAARSRPPRRRESRGGCGGSGAPCAASHERSAGSHAMPAFCSRGSARTRCLVRCAAIRTAGRSSRPSPGPARCRASGDRRSGPCFQTSARRHPQRRRELYRRPSLARATRSTAASQSWRLRSPSSTST